MTELDPFQTADQKVTCCSPSVKFEPHFKFLRNKPAGEYFSEQNAEPEIFEHHHLLIWN